MSFQKHTKKNQKSQHSYKGQNNQANQNTQKNQNNQSNKYNKKNIHDKFKAKKRFENPIQPTSETNKQINKINKNLQGITFFKDKILTENKVPGKTVYSENLIKINNKEYREWIPEKSKLCASIKKGISQIGIKPESTILYLGSSTGTTVSHISDMLTTGFIFAVDLSARMMRDFVFMAQERKNIAPILSSASNTDYLKDKIFEVDVVYQDIAQSDQARIFLENCRHFLIDEGFGLLCVKSRSIDITKKPKEVYEIVKQQLEQELIIVDQKELDPYQKHHILFVCKKK